MFLNQQNLKINHELSTFNFEELRGGFLRERKRVRIRTLESTTVELDGGAHVGRFLFCYIAESGLSSQISLLLKTPYRVFLVVVGFYGKWLE